MDSGAGGLTVARAIAAELPGDGMIYAADTAGFPYGDWIETQLVSRLEALAGQLSELTVPDVIVIACNTASTIALERLRRRFDVPFVGTVPAIKPASERSSTGVIGVLATPGTARREYTGALIDTYAYHCHVKVHGAAKLAAMAEDKLKGRMPDKAVLAEEIAAVFQETPRGRTDCVVLGCTHYPLLAEDIRHAAPWPVELIDPAPAIARRVRTVLDERKPVDVRNLDRVEPGTVITTSGEPLCPDMVSAYAQFGFDRVKNLSVPRGVAAD